MKPILEIRDLGKKYRIQGESPPYLSLRESLFSFLKPGGRKQEFWALQDLSLDIQPGDTLGIIGRNGAGKSTLLKILSKITPPSTGSVICRGRIASLLEVGTGFHPELSGRENIFLNGSILGMKKQEIRRQFDAIVDFAGVSRFIDTPLKHYSSGMQLRLAFAVAAFLEPEILVIDEVLAVGDSEFQKKCMRKMEDVSRHGRTILFVSHDLNAVSTLTRKCLFLKAGRAQLIADTPQVVEAYIRDGADRELVFEKQPVKDLESPQILRVELETSLPHNVHEHGQPLRVTVEGFAAHIPRHETWVSLQLSDLRGKGIVHVTRGSRATPFFAKPGPFRFSCTFPSLRLYQGKYLLSVYMAGPPNTEVYERLREVVPLEVIMRAAPHDYGWQPDVCTYLEDSEWQAAEPDELKTT